MPRRCGMRMGADWGDGPVVWRHCQRVCGEPQLGVSRGGGSGGRALSWDGSPALQQALREAAGQIHVPLLGMVAENDRTTHSVKVVVAEAEKHGGSAKLIVPAFSPREHHGDVAPEHLIFGVEDARIWEKDLQEFLEKEIAGKNYAENPPSQTEGGAPSTARNGCATLVEGAHGYAA